MTASDFASVLRGADLRVTAPRLAILAAVENRPHSEAETIFGDVSAALGSVSRQAVYDSLNILADVGVLRRIAPSARAALYEIAPLDNHHHFLCRECGSLFDVPCQVGSAPCLNPPENHRMEVDVAEVLYRGTCSNCLTTSV